MSDILEMLIGLLSGPGGIEERLADLERQDSGASGGSNSPVFIPAIGGSYDYDETAPRTYGGGPWCGGTLIDYYQVGLSFQPLGGGTASAFNFGAGILTVPDGVTHIAAVPVFRTTFHASQTFGFFNEILGYDEDGCVNGDVYGYGEAANVGRNICDFGQEEHIVVTAAIMESDVVAGQHLTLSMSTTDRGAFSPDCLFFLGWQAELS